MNVMVRIAASPFFSAGVGAVLGYAYYRYIGCATGTCPITSNPWISTIYGAVLGYMIAGIIMRG